MRAAAPVDTAHTRWGCFPAQVKGPLTPTGSRHAGGGRHSGPRRRGFAAPRVPIRPGSLPGHQVGIPSLWTDSHCDGEAATALRGPLHTHVQKEREESGAPRNPEGQLQGSEGPVGGMDRLAVTGAGGRRRPGARQEGVKEGGPELCGLPAAPRQEGAPRSWSSSWQQRDGPLGPPPGWGLGLWEPPTHPEGVKKAALQKVLLGSGAERGGRAGEGAAGAPGRKGTPFPTQPISPQTPSGHLDRWG